MRSTVETLEGNKVKVVVEVEEAEFEKDLDAAFARLAKEVRLPGFRPGKAPRKVLEARIGQGYARDEAFREALPTYYSEAVKEHEVDVIAAPEIDITAGQEDGPVSFDAVVEIRPTVEVSDYEGLEIEIPSLEVTEGEVDAAVDRMRGQFAELETVERPAQDGDSVVMDIAAEHQGEGIPGMTTSDYNYKVGSGATGIPEIDENLTGASAGDTLEFSADHPDEDEDEPIQFSITVTEVQESVLPEPTDAWVADNSEFDTLEALRADYLDKMTRSRLAQAQTVRRDRLANDVAEMVDDDTVPEAMIDGEVESRIQDMAMRLQAQGIEFEQYMQLTGQDRESMLAEMRTQGTTAAKLDLALRAIAATESIDVTEEELDTELETVATQFDSTVDAVKEELTNAGQLPAVKADLVKSKTLDWLLERAKLVDEDGQPVSADALEMPDDETTDDTADNTADNTAEDTADDASDGEDTPQAAETDEDNESEEDQT